MKLSNLKIDATRGQQGAWIDGIPNMGDLRVKVRGFSNSDYTAFIAKEMAAIPRDQREDGRAQGSVKPAIAQAIISRGIVEFILLDWNGLTDANDEPLAYSKETAASLLLDPNYRPLRDAVAYAASVVEEVAADKIEAPLGNS